MFNNIGYFANLLASLVAAATGYFIASAVFLMVAFGFFVTEEIRRRRAS